MRGLTGFYWIREGVTGLYWVFRVVFVFYFSDFLVGRTRGSQLMDAPTAGDRRGTDWRLARPAGPFIGAAPIKLAGTFDPVAAHLSVAVRSIGYRTTPSGWLINQQTHETAVNAHQCDRLGSGNFYATPTNETNTVIVIWCVIRE